MAMSVILAAGKGTRMRSDLPKLLHDLMGVPLLEYVLEKVEELGCDPRVVVVGHEMEKVQAGFSTEQTGGESILTELLAPQADLVQTAEHEPVGAAESSREPLGQDLRTADTRAMAQLQDTGLPNGSVIRLSLGHHGDHLIVSRNALFPKMRTNCTN